MRHKNQKPPICIGGSENLALWMRPRYMNAPFPSLCHAKVPGVGQQSVWGLRIIVCSSSSLLHHSCNSSIPKSGGRAGSQTRICSFGRYHVVQLHYPPTWNSRRESNPDLFVRTEASSCFRLREPNQIW